MKERVKSVLNYRKPAFWVIILGLLACAATAVYLMTNPVDKSDTITYIHHSTSIGNRADFDVHFGKKAQSAELRVELWQHGQNKFSDSIVISSDTEQFSVLCTDIQENMYLIGENIQIDTNKAAAALITLLHLPEGVRGWSFSSWKDKQTVEIEGGKEIILAAMNYDVGSGVRSVFDLLEKSNQQIPDDIDCVLIVRAIFHADEISEPLETAQSRDIDYANAVDFSSSVKCTPQTGHKKFWNH